MSTQPGVTRRLRASITSAFAGRDGSPAGPTSTMRPPDTTTSASNGGAPVPSTTGPPEITRSAIGPCCQPDRRSTSNPPPTMAGSGAGPPTPGRHEDGGGAVEPVLEVVGVSKRFGSIQAMHDVSFHVAPGETYGLLGPNGAGKSTTISIAVGLIDPDAGQIRVLGRPLTGSSTDVRASIGYVPQDVAVYPDLSAREN